MNGPDNSGITEGLGLAEGELRLSDPVPAWADAFIREAARLNNYLRQARGELEHIGSTAVPGLAAKPILDLAARLPDPAALSSFEASLPGLDYRLRDDAGESGGRVWIREKAGRRTHILHVVLENGQQWRDWLDLLALFAAVWLLALRLLFSPIGSNTFRGQPNTGSDAFDTCSNDFIHGENK